MSVSSERTWFVPGISRSGRVYRPSEKAKENLKMSNPGTKTGTGTKPQDSGSLIPLAAHHLNTEIESEPHQTNAETGAQGGLGRDPERDCANLHNMPSEKTKIKSEKSVPCTFKQVNSKSVKSDVTPKSVKSCRSKDSKGKKSYV